MKRNLIISLLVNTDMVNHFKTGIRQSFFGLGAQRKNKG